MVRHIFTVVSDVHIHFLNAPAEPYQVRCQNSKRADTEDMDAKDTGIPRGEY